MNHQDELVEVLGVYSKIGEIVCGDDSPSEDWFVVTSSKV